jgi:hypothetical protein
MRILKIAMIGVVLVGIDSTGIGGGQILPAASLPWTTELPSRSQTETQQRIEQQKMAVVERQKRLVEDTDKLLALTTALKEQVSETDKNVLPVDMLKKAEQIEKLAHSVKERIKG